MTTIKNYTNEDLEYIKNNYTTATIKQIADHLNKTPNSIYNAVRKLGLKKQEHRPWTAEEINYLKENYIEQTSEQIANVLHRTIDAVNTQRDRLGLVRNQNWTDEEVLFLCQNFDKYKHEEIGEKLGRTTSAITAKCFELNLYKKELPWEEWEINFLKENYLEMTNVEISKILNRTESAIHLKASRLGFKKYPYTCDYHYFDIIDNEEKAYWLGFLTADGWINKNDKSNAGVVGCELQYGDIGHLKKFNKSIKGNYQIIDRWKPCPISTKDTLKKNHTCMIRIFSITMYNTLVKLGFDNNKSYNFQIPNLESHLLRHYIRGYFDGDGCFSLTNKTFSIGFITASEKLNIDLLDYIRSQSIDIKEYSYVNDYGNVMYYPQIYKTQDKLKFLDWIYQDANIYLDRKYKKYLKAKEKYDTHVSLAS